MCSQQDLDEYLLEFADSLSPPYEATKRCNQLVHWLLENIKKEFQGIYSIDRLKITGSVKKNTAILQPDYDCVALLNNLDPPFHDVTENFYSFLTSRDYVSCLYKTNYAVRLLLNNEVFVDLLPGSNQVAPLFRIRNRLNADEVINFQINNTLDILYQSMDPREFKLYSTSLAEHQVDFMQRQSDFVLRIVKLSKFWYKTACCTNGNTNRSIPGLKFLVELVAVYFAQKEESASNRKHRPLSATRALLNIFCALSCLGRLSIVFYKNAGLTQGKIRRIIEGTCFLPNFIIPPEILDREYFVIDPANPYNDILETVMSYHSMGRNNILPSVERYAQKTWLHLNRVLDQVDGGGIREISCVFRMYKNRSFKDLVLDKEYEFVVACNYFEGWNEYLNMKQIHEKKSRDIIPNAVETAFMTSAAIESFKYRIQERNAYFGDVLANSKSILCGIMQQMELNPRLLLLTRAEEISFENDYVRFYKGTQFIDLLNQVRSISDNNKIYRIFMYPILKTESDLGGQTIYCCSLFVLTE